MQLKEIIRKIENTSLLQLFLDFTRKFQLQYEKISKEISFKCHQATWILASVKATGYGRTEMQAYNHALRNLLQLLIEDKVCHNFFINAFKELGIKIAPYSQIQKKYQIKQKIKTENNQPYCQTQLKKIDSHSRFYLGNHDQPFKNIKECKIISNENKQARRQTQSKQKIASLNSSLYTNMKKNSDSNPMVSSLKNQCVNRMQNSKSRSSYNCLYINMQANKKSCSGYKNQKNQLQQAKQKLSDLQKKLISVQDQNQMLKIMIHKYENCEKSAFVSHISPKQSCKNIKSKVSIPKLKLEILPNYHKKCQKSLNQALLTVYNKAHHINA